MQREHSSEKIGMNGINRVQIDCASAQCKTGHLAQQKVNLRLNALCIDRSMQCAMYNEHILQT